MDIAALFVNIFDPLPAYPSKQRAVHVPHAPKRPCPLNRDEKILAVRNALRYIPKRHHDILSKEFAEELEKYGHIYAFRFMPNFDLKAPSLNEIPAKCQQAAAIIMMILNNLDPAVAQFPQELVTYGGNGQVFSNWIQFRLVLLYLSEMNLEQTLVMYSGHPLGLFPSHRDAPRVTITNGMMIPNYSTKPLYDKYFALGVTQYGQMTAGSYCYIGPQGIVHGTTITILNAGRRYLGAENLKGKVFVTAGLGGMSGAQPKAATIAGCISVTAEVIPDALMKRHKQGWLDEYSNDLNEIIEMIRKYRKEQKTRSIGYLGNVVDLWERLAAEKELLVDLGSDQTSLHNPFLGGYYPAGISVDEANTMMTKDPERFKQLVQKSLLRQIAAIDKLSARGMHFWDYGNAFLVECQRAGADLRDPKSKDDKTFRYPSYMQDIMGDIFSMGFGPFRWVCTSQDPDDLAQTDRISCEVIDKLLKTKVPDHVLQQYMDNKKWIEGAAENRLVVGSQARILYSDQEGRLALALAFNDAVRNGKVSAPIVIARDHHDVSGTDSPFRETSDISDGSAFTADMAVQNVIGDSFRGATWVSLHNGGGVGWGDVINGGFGLLLDGSEEAARRATSMLQWDVSNGVARRSWSGNRKAREAIQRTQTLNENMHVTIPNDADDQLLERLF
ncbi:urocanate hydratase [Trichostrongylus colubriformis]|uniref:Urocanate hydratase n=1 Tax=Trichostrongylus colubriformis TaxID=6319 RepID=A0AAN8IXS7_TRICO